MPRQRNNPQTTPSASHGRIGTGRPMPSAAVLRLFMLGILLSGLVLAGCGPPNPPTVEVKGVVTLDAQPVEGAAVVFTPSEGRPATGRTDAAGEFVLSTFKQGDGAVPGKHRVTVSKTSTKPSSAGEEGELVFLVPKQYGNQSTTPLVCEVRPEMPPVRLELQSAAPAPPRPAAEVEEPMPEAQSKPPGRE